MLLLAITGGTLPIATAWLQRAVLDGVVPHGHPAHQNMSHIVVLAIILGGIGMIAACSQYGRSYVQAEMRRGLGMLVQDRMACALNSFPGMSRFESPEFADQIRLVQQVSQDSGARLASSALQLGQSLITAAGMFGTLAVISPVLAGIVGGTAVPAVVAQLSNSRRSARLEWRKTPAQRRQMFYSQLMSDQAAAKEVRLFGLGGFLRDRMLGELRSINTGQRSLDRRILVIEGSLAVLAAGVTAAGLVWVVRQAVSGRLSVGDVSLFALAVVAVQAAISMVISQFAAVYRSLLMFGHYVDIVSAGPDLPLAEPAQPVPPLRRGIELRDVWFRYDRAHPWVLRGVSLFIPAGQSVALIGLNGAGKSTLVKLICRFYDPERGAILWDGTDIRDTDPEELRARIGTVFQDYMTYDLTAAENIGLGDLARLGDRPRIRDAAVRAGADDQLARLPRGYDTLLSRIFFGNKDRDNPETGVFLSGGQWQRVAVARGFMRADRDLLILDEPSSGLDAQAEFALHQRLYQIRQGRTSVLISHRLSSVRDVDLIYVLSSGEVAEQGTHATLMAAGGEYHRLFTLQGSGYQEPKRPAGLGGK
jgi:ATP-binding cassette subfamily B protein